MRVRLFVGVTVALIASFGAAGGGAPASARDSAAQAPPFGCSGGPGQLHGAFAFGVPRRSVAGVRQAGAVDVRAWENGQLRRTLTSPMLGVPAQPRGRFGAATAVAQLTQGDYCPDLVVGMPGANGARGAVAIVPDFGHGLNPAAAVWLPVNGVDPRPGDALGEALATWDPDDGGGSLSSSLIVAGMPGRDLAGGRDAGALVTWTLPWTDPFGPAPVAPVDHQIRPRAPRIHVQGARGIPDRSEAGDRFGSVLEPGWAARVTVGVPGEDVGKRRDAGAVTTLSFALPEGRVSSAVQRWLGHGLPGKPRKGDQLGAAVAAAGDAIGVPGRDANGRKDSGAVVVRRYKDDPNGSTVPGPFRLITQNTRKVPDRSERGDRFGAALAEGCELRERYQCTIAVGAPGEDVKGRRDAGAVTYIDVRDYAPWFKYGSQKVSGLAAGDRFGSRFAVARIEADEDSYALLAISAPGRDRPGKRNAGRWYWANISSGEPHRRASTFANGSTRGERLGDTAPGP